MLNPRAKKIATAALRWGIAVLGIYYVLSNLSLHDRVLIQGRDGWPQSLKLDASKYSVEHSPQEADFSYAVIDADGQSKTIGADQLLVKTDPGTVHLRDEGSSKNFDVLALKVSEGQDRNQWPLLVAEKRNLAQKFFSSHATAARIVPRSDIASDYNVGVAYQRVDVGLISMWELAEKMLFVAALVVFPVTFLLTAYRWHELLKALDIMIASSRTFALNMVGAFYNTFMPGSTGGDVLKAYYASKQTPHRTRAVMSVLVDRLIGLIALIMLGSVAAATQWDVPACRRIAIGGALVCLAVFAGLVVFYTPVLRRLSGFNFVVARLPMQKQIGSALHVMEIYRRRAWLVIWSIVVSFPVHATVVLAAMLCGMAFHLPLFWGYYWALVPVIVLAGAIPISPQGAGVMEFFAIMLTKNHGCTVGQAFALTMSIRMVQIIWNLAGGVFVLRGGFHAPTKAQRHEVEEAVEEDDDQPSGSVPAAA